MPFWRAPKAILVLICRISARNSVSICGRPPVDGISNANSGESRPDANAPAFRVADIGILPPIKERPLTMKVEWPAFTVERWLNHSPDQLRLA